MKFNTFNGWKLRGRQVMQGEKGQFRNEYGDYMFARSQTKSMFDDVEFVVVRRDRLGRFATI